jgi:hypothetical protein
MSGARCERAGFFFVRCRARKLENGNGAVRDPSGASTGGGFAMQFAKLMLIGLVGIYAMVTVAQVPAPPTVPGKVYSDIPDHEWDNALPDPHQNILWDGTGGAGNEFDYTGSFPAGIATPDVDATANIQDLLFWDLVADQKPMVVSVDEFRVEQLWWQETAIQGGTTGLWSVNVDMNQTVPPENVDGLEVWGSNFDTNVFSLENDTFDTAVWAYDALNAVSTPYVLNSQLRAALGLPAGAPAIDLDALLVYDELADGMFDVGDAIIFSVRENGMFDGGELWVYEFALGIAQPLVHGGVVWDTANPVGPLFNVATEDIDALEVIPEPQTLALVLLALGACARRQR